MIYLATPYSHPDPDIVQGRYRKAQYLTAWLIARGHHVFSPICHCHELVPIADLGSDAAFWKEYNQAMIRRADRMFVGCLSGWKDSIGVRMEISLAQQLGIPVEYFDEKGLPILGEPR
jgi:hypothetical protein